MGNKNLGDYDQVHVGALGTNVTVEEFGDPSNHVTKLTLASVPITIGDTAALAVGSLIYTFPAGIIHVQAAECTVGLALTTGTPTTDTPEIALGTTLASGANATIGAADAAAENIAGPAVMDDVAGTAEVFDSVTAAGTKSNTLVIGAADDHTVYVNFADTWANVDDTAATASGTVYLVWTLLA